MKSFCKALQTELESQLQFIRLETENHIKAAELSIKILPSLPKNNKTIFAKKCEVILLSKDELRKQTVSTNSKTIS